MKKFSVKTLVAIGIGSALFFVLGRYVTIPSPVPNTSINIQYGLLAFLASVYGPLAGALVGFIGHTLIDLTWGMPWWSWVVASAVFGLQVGIGAKMLHFKDGELGKYGLVKFNIVQVIAHAVSWLVVALLLDMWWFSEPFSKVLAQGISAALSNAITTAIVGGLLCVAYTATKPKAGSLDKE